MQGLEVHLAYLGLMAKQHIIVLVSVCRSLTVAPEPEPVPPPPVNLVSIRSRPLELKVLPPWICQGLYPMASCPRPANNYAAATRKLEPAAAVALYYTFFEVLVDYFVEVVCCFLRGATCSVSIAL